MWKSTHQRMPIVTPQGVPELPVPIQLKNRRAETMTETLPPDEVVVRFSSTDVSDG